MWDFKGIFLLCEEENWPHSHRQSSESQQKAHGRSECKFLKVTLALRSATRVRLKLQWRGWSLWDCWVCLCAALFISSHRGTKAANSSHTSALSLMSLTFIKHVWLPLWWCHRRIMNEGVSSEEKMRAGTWQPTSSTERPRHREREEASERNTRDKQLMPRDVPEPTRALTDVLLLSNTLYTR